MTVGTITPNWIADYLFGIIYSNDMLRIISLLLITTSVSLGCASIMNSATSKMADNLSAAILNQNDPETVRAGAPAYLLLIDSLIEDNPDDPGKLATGAKLYSAYASIFVTDKERAQRLAQKSMDYATRALCLHNQPLCEAYTQPFVVFAPVLAQTGIADVPMLYMFGSTWASWVQINSGDWNSIADLPKINAMMQRIVTLDEGYEQGGAHLYLGVFASQLPPSLGGKPELARQNFEQAIALSHGQNLMAKVLFARHYARLLYNRELHDRLLNEVLAAQAEAPGLTLINSLAKQEAKSLLDSADAYF